MHEAVGCSLCRREDDLGALRCRAAWEPRAVPCCPVGRQRVQGCRRPLLWGDAAARWGGSHSSWPTGGTAFRGDRAEEASTQLVARRGARANPDSVSIISYHYHNRVFWSWLGVFLCLFVRLVGCLCFFLFVFVFLFVINTRAVNNVIWWCLQVISL